MYNMSMGAGNMGAGLGSYATYRRPSLDGFKFPECTGVSNVMKVGRKSVSGSWTRVEETIFFKSSSRS